MSERPPNSHECEYNGRKLTNVDCNTEINCGEIHIGSDQDDEISIYEDNVLRERVKIFILDHTLEEISIDLEDVLRFAVKNCYGIYERVFMEKEITPDMVIMTDVASLLDQTNV